MPTKAAWFWGSSAFFLGRPPLFFGSAAGVSKLDAGSSCTTLDFLGRPGLFVAVATGALEERSLSLGTTAVLRVLRVAGFETRVSCFNTASVCSGVSVKGSDTLGETAGKGFG